MIYFHENNYVTDINTTIGMSLGFCRLCEKLIIKNNAIDAAIETSILIRTKKRSSRDVMRLICERTIRQGKIVEEIHISEMLDGILTQNIYGTHLRKSTLYGILQDLNRLHFIVRVYYPRHSTMLYGLHLPNVLSAAKRCWEGNNLETPPEFGMVMELLKHKNHLFDSIQDIRIQDHKFFIRQLTA